MPDDATPDQSERRGADDAEQWLAVGDQGQIDREFLMAGDEFARAVEGVDQEKAVPVGRGGAAGPLLRERRHVGREPDKTLGNHRIRGEIRFRHQGSVGFSHDLHGLAVDIEDRQSGAGDKIGQRGQQRQGGITFENQGFHGHPLLVRSHCRPTRAARVSGIPTSGRY